MKAKMETMMLKMKRIRWSRIAFLAIFLMCSARWASAQVQTGGVEGVVTDGKGAAIPGASVIITDVDTGATRPLTTDSGGRFAASSLNIGHYSVRAVMDGFAPQTQQGLVLTIGQVMSINFSLQIGAVSQEVTVNSSETAQVNTTSSETGALVESAQLQSLPLNGRNAEQLVALVPGVQPVVGVLGGANFGNAQKYSIAGARVDAGTILLDGLEVRGFWGASAGLNITGTSLGVESIAEFSTLTSSFNAQYNGASVISEVTRSGTNNFHGSAYGYFRNSAMDARNFFDPATGPPAFHRNQFGGAIGGPIRKNKTFFFANYEGIRAELALHNNEVVPDANAHAGMLPCAATTVGCSGAPSTTLVNVGVASAVEPYLALYPNYGQPGGPPLPAGYSDNPSTGTASFNSIGEQPQIENYFALKLDHQLTDKNNLSFRWVVDRGTENDPWFGSSTAPSPGLIAFANSESDPEANWYGTLQDRHIFSANLVNVATFGYVRTNQQQTINLAGVPDILKTFSSQVAAGSIAIGGVASIPAPAYQPLQQLQNVFTEQDEVDWIHGAHSFKFGGGVTRIDCNCVQASNSGGAWTFPTLQGFLQNQPSQYAGEFTASSLSAAEAAIRYARQTNISGFIQDDWRATKRLTINLGIRDDYVTNPIEIRGDFYNVLHLDPLTCSNNPACDNGMPEAGVSTGFTQVPHMFKNNPSTRNIDPRVGIAWDILGNGKISFRAAYGTFHAVIYPRSYTPGSGFIYPNGTTQLTSFGPGNTFPRVSPAAIIPQSRTMPDYNICCTPYMQEWNATVEAQVPWGLKVTAGYIGSEGTHLYDSQSFNTNIPVPGTQFRPLSPAKAAGLPICTVGGPSYSSAGCTAASNGYGQSPGVGYTPNVAFTSVSWFEAAQNSNYHGAVLSVSRKVAEGIQLTSGFTFSRCLDYGSSDIVGGGDVGGDSEQYLSPAVPKKYNYGPCAFNISKNWTSSALIPLPFHGNRLKEGWQVAAISSIRNGTPQTANLASTFDQENLGQYVYATERANVNPTFTGPFVNLQKHLVNGAVPYFNPSAFTVGTLGQLGNASRGTINGPNVADVDLSIVKNTRLPKLGESNHLELRGDFFNVLNHTNFNSPNTTIFNGSIGKGVPNQAAGTISSTITPARQLQFSARFVF